MEINLRYMEMKDVATDDTTY